MNVKLIDSMTAKVKYHTNCLGVAPATSATLEGGLQAPFGKAEIPSPKGPLVFNSACARAIRGMRGQYGDEFPISIAHRIFKSVCARVLIGSRGLNKADGEQAWAHTCHARPSHRPCGMAGVVSLAYVIVALLQLTAHWLAAWTRGVVQGVERSLSQIYPYGMTHEHNKGSKRFVSPMTLGDLGRIAVEKGDPGRWLSMLSVCLFAPARHEIAGHKARILPSRTYYIACARGVKHQWAFGTWDFARSNGAMGRVAQGGWTARPRDGPHAPIAHRKAALQP